MRLSVLMLGMLLLGGCAATGVHVTDDQARSFRVGQSTYREVVAALGPPTTTASMANGQRMAIYSYASVQSRPQNFIPYIGPLVAGYDSKSSAVTFVFDQRDVLASTSSTQTGLGSAANLGAGMTQPTATQAQPR